MAYYVVKLGDALDIPNSVPHETLHDAQCTARDRRDNRPNTHWTIFKVEAVWSTQTLGDLRKQGLI